MSIFLNFRPLYHCSDFVSPELVEGRIPTLPRLSLPKADFNHLSSALCHSCPQPSVFCPLSSVI
ncbi:hypothetical protein D1AOALGA4SA_9861 [Olavius algarvensis Delta 1 endosymbiont]|nr:hypothetical protein D1AOALGA4SA_9861 [Olavius algarvensis Delta 1 endosymbiont]